MKLFDCSTAPSPRRVRIFAAEKGIELERVEVDLAGGEQLQPAFRKINPECTVPVLELDDGRHVSEVIAICDYLEGRCPEPPLLGRDAGERAEVLMWNSRLEQQGLLAIAEHFRNTLPGLKSRAVAGPDNFEQIPALAERGSQRAQRFFRRLDEHLQGRDYIAGAGFSMADITALVAVDFARWSKLDLTADAAELPAWYRRVSARDSAKA